MAITTSTYGKEIILTALGYYKGWREQNCKEDDVSCYQYLFDNNYTTVIGKDWCAYTATEIVNDAGDKVGVDCPIPFGGSSRAIVDIARKKGIRVDRTPSIGCIFWYPRNAAKTLGHAGIVVWGDENGIFTVEGNSSDDLKCIGCPTNGIALIGSKSSRSYKSMADKDTWYIHIEEVGNTPPVTIDNIFALTPEQKSVSPGQQQETVLNAGMSPFAAMLLLSVAIGGVYVATK